MNLRHTYNVVEWRTRVFLERWDRPLFIAACILAVAFSFWLAESAAAQDDPAAQECGDAGGIFGRPFRKQFDRPEIKIVPIWYDTQAELKAVCDWLAITHYDMVL